MNKVHPISGAIWAVGVCDVESIDGGIASSFFRAGGITGRVWPVIHAVFDDEELLSHKD